MHPLVSDELFLPLQLLEVTILGVEKCNPFLLQFSQVQWGQQNVSISRSVLHIYRFLLNLLIELIMTESAASQTSCCTIPDLVSSKIS